MSLRLPDMTPNRNGLLIMAYFRGHSWSLVVIRGHSWSFVVTRGHSRVLLDKTVLKCHISYQFKSKFEKLNKYSFANDLV